MTIHVLPDEIASQIAAGEVVERPASVVKELVENSLDAGASAIQVELLEAGRKLIRVTDDGSGIPAQELRLAVERHATSKLDNAEDLFRIQTLGFRGEALASIGSVARLTITSRPAIQQGGARLRVEGGKVGKLEQIGAPQGTQVAVEDLFYNIPARLKFLKQDLTERRAVDALLARYAIAYPQVRFRYSDGGSVALETAGDGDQRAILAGLYGVDVARQMLEVHFLDGDLLMDGFISPVSLTRSNRRELTFFINGRWVQNVPLNTALLQAYHTLLMVGRFPMAVIFVSMPPETVDVNVHPAKAEVRFREQDKVFSFVQRGVRRTLLATTAVPQIAPERLWGGTDSDSTRMIDPAWSLGHPSEGGAFPSPDSPSQMHTGTPPLMGNIPLLRLVGQIGASYLVAEGPDGLYLIDQHAAHERVLFEKLMHQHGEKSIPAQALLSPAVVELEPAAARLLTDQLPVMKHFGFEVEPFGGSSFQVRAMPALFGDSDPAAALRAVVEDFEEDETPLQNEVEHRIAGRICKRLAVKAGKVLSGVEQRTLLNDLEACASPRTCPHGRPTMIHLSVDMLERQFGRRGPR